MKTNVVQTLWIDPVLGDHQKLCMDSFIKQGCEVHLYSYQDVKNVPLGIAIKDANDILDKKCVFKDLYGSYATFSDWFRIKLLYDLGGWWVDSDMLCVKPFDIDWPYVFASEVEHTQDDEVTHICNCVIKMPKGSEMGGSILKRIEKTLSTVDPKNITWTEIGAKYMATEIVNRNLFDYIVEPAVFCPFDYSSFKTIFNGTEVEIEEITYGIHLWNKMWEWSAKDPLTEMDENSFFSKYFKDQ